ncbi:MoaD/ThiS family protein [Gynuella sunshinyii]|uniref:Molybdopterin converting factor, small subunit n=1 Tax=Gynuella sunshinyii YC6258 TaxID=1445510 RepID=A0A0C5VGB8_9GAMM|nr:MoaD/ThiS family protein [Gynuella sunshinyii]AJQ93652.1 hypothetical Protein YC6258_01604 [Gynuella sunshinyii YC6258]
MSIKLNIVLQPPLDALFPHVEDTFETQDGNLVATLTALCADSEAAQKQVLHGEELSPYIHVFINGRQVTARMLADVSLQEGDELCLLTAIRGG